MLWRKSTEEGQGMQGLTEKVILNKGLREREGGACHAVTCGKSHVDRKAHAKP